MPQVDFIIESLVCPGQFSQLQLSRVSRPHFRTLVGEALTYYTWGSHTPALAERRGKAVDSGEQLPPPGIKH